MNRIVKVWVPLGGEKATNQPLGHGNQNWRKLGIQRKNLNAENTNTGIARKKRTKGREKMYQGGKTGKNGTSKKSAGATRNFYWTNG